MKTNREAHEKAAGMSLEKGFFTFNNIDPDAEYMGTPEERVIRTVDRWCAEHNVCLDYEKKQALTKAVLRTLPRIDRAMLCTGSCMEIDEYLSSNPLNNVGAGSILHQRLKWALGACTDVAIKKTSAYTEYAKLILQLHDLIASGKSDTEEAEAVRERMDDFYYHRLTESELKSLSSVSGDLYLLTDEDIYIATKPEQREEFRKDLSFAIKTKNWGKVLDLLRYDLLISRKLIAYFRARAYREKLPFIAERFLEWSIKEDKNGTR